MSAPPLAPDARIERLWDPVEAFDEKALALDLETAVQDLGVEAAVLSVVLPFLADVGERWEGGRASVAHEHFASQLLRRLLHQHANPYDDDGDGPIAVLACPPSERHDLGLLCFAVLLGRAGWQVRWLGAETPITALALACRVANADVAVLAATRASAFEAIGEQVRSLSARQRIVIAGAGASPDLARSVEAGHLDPDMHEAIEELSALVGHTNATRV